MKTKVRVYQAVEGTNGERLSRCLVVTGDKRPGCNGVYNVLYHESRNGWWYLDNFITLKEKV